MSKSDVLLPDLYQFFLWQELLQQELDQEPHTLKYEKTRSNMPLPMRRGYQKRTVKHCKKNKCNHAIHASWHLVFPSCHWFCRETHYSLLGQCSVPHLPAWQRLHGLHGTTETNSGAIPGLSLDKERHSLCRTWRFQSSFFDKMRLYKEATLSNQDGWKTVGVTGVPVR